MKIKLSLADINISAEINYDTTLEYCRDYLADFETPEVELSVLWEDILAERDKYHADCERAGVERKRLTPNYFETLALYRKICDALIDFDIVLLHGSALAVDGEGFMFTAKSGVGKSTHAALYRELFGARVEMINDDKPLVRLKGDKVYAYGTPWNGKHKLSSNICRSLGAICLISRGGENAIFQLSKRDAFAEILSKAHKQKKRSGVERTVMIIDKILDAVKVYRLECNTDISAAELSYNTMKGKRNED